MQNVIGLAVLAVIVLAAGSLTLGKLVPQDGTVLSDWKAAAVEKIRDLRYGGSNEVLPDGSFSGLGSFQPKGDAVLTVTMSQHLIICEALSEVITPGMVGKIRMR